MCGRYRFDAEMDALIAAWKLLQHSIRYEKQAEIRPTDAAPVLFADGQLRLLRWGFQPNFSKRPLINARGETVTEKPTFREAFRRRRCIIPATGFFEWKDRGAKGKEKHLFTGSEGFLAMAGLWEIFTIGDASVACFTILTTAATEAMNGIHNRMPVFLRPHERTLYLNHRKLSPRKWDEILEQNEIQLTHGTAE